MKLHAVKGGAHNSASELFDSRPSLLRDRQYGVVIVLIQNDTEIDNFAQMEFGSWSTRLAGLIGRPQVYTLKHLIGYSFSCLVNLFSRLVFKLPISSYNLSCVTILYFCTGSSLLSPDAWLGEGWDYTL